MKSLNKIEKFVCEIIWGAVPVDADWVRETQIFKDGVLRFEKGEFKQLWSWQKNIS